MAMQNFRPMDAAFLRMGMWTFLKFQVGCRISVLIYIICIYPDHLAKNSRYNPKIPEENDQSSDRRGGIARIRN